MVELLGAVVIACPTVRHGADCVPGLELWPLWATKYAPAGIE